MSLAAKLSSRFVLMVCGRVALLALGLAATALLTRLLGPAGFGNYRAAVAYLALFVALADFGLASIFVRQISRQGADQSRIVSNALSLRFLLAGLLFAVACLLSFILPFNPSERFGVLAGAAGFVAYSAHLMLFGLFQQKLRQQGAVLAELSGGVVLLILIVVLGQLGADPALFVASLGTSYLVTLVISLVFARRLVSFKLMLEWDQCLQLIRPALPLALTGVLSVIYVRADSVLLAFLKEPEAVGVYGVPVKISDSLFGIALLFTGLIAPFLAESAVREQARFGELLNGSIKASLIGSTAVALGFAALAEEVIWLLAGSSFSEGAPILRLLGVFFVLHSVTLLLREACIALDKQRRLVPAYVVGGSVAIVAYLLLIPELSGQGAALALVLGECFVLAGFIRVVYQALAPETALRIPVAEIACGLLATALLIFAIVNGWSWPARVGVVLTGYCLLLFLTGAVTWSMLKSFIEHFLAKRRGQ